MLQKIAVLSSSKPELKVQVGGNSLLGSQCSCVLCVCLSVDADARRLRLSASGAFRSVAGIGTRGWRREVASAQCQAGCGGDLAAAPEEQTDTEHHSAVLLVSRLSPDMPGSRSWRVAG